MLAGGCEKDEPASAGEISQRGCRMPFPEYDAGRDVAGHTLQAVVTNCGSRPFVTYVYGTCKAGSDSGCAPPVEVQTWSYCHRKPRRTSATDFGVLRKAGPADPSLPLTRKLRACGGR
jgi:hypothetical protein